MKDIKFKPISVIQLQKISNAIEKKYDLEKPTYEMKLPGNNVQVKEYDAESIADESTPDEDKEKWRQYQEQLLRMQSEVNEKTTAYAFYKGVDCEVDPEWIEEQQWLGIDLPEDKRDLKVQYIMTGLLKTAYDVKKAIAEIMKLSMKGADPAAIKAAEDTFLSQVEA